MTDNTSIDDLDLWPEDLEPGRFDPTRQDPAELWPLNLSEFDYEMLGPRDSSPSAPIILLSAAIGLLVGMIAFFVLYQALWLRLEFATGFSLVMLFIGLAATSIGLSNLTRSAAMMSNLAFSCGLILICVLFFGLCIVTGALGATVLMLLAN